MYQQTPGNGRVVFTRVTSNVFHQYLGSIHGETVDLRIDTPYLLPVDIAVNSTERTESSQLLRYFQ